MLGAIAILAMLAFLVLLTLAFTGIIAPPWLRNLIQRYEKWRFGDASPLFPMDPSKPLSEAFDASKNQFPPLSQRMNNAGKELLVAYGVGILIFLLLMWFVTATHY